MVENIINVPKSGKIINEDDLKKDKRKAYMIMLQTSVLAISLTYLMFLI